MPPPEYQPRFRNLYQRGHVRCPILQSISQFGAFSSPGTGSPAFTWVVLLILLDNKANDITRTPRIGLSIQKCGSYVKQTIVPPTVSTRLKSKIRSHAVQRFSRLPRELSKAKGFASHTRNHSTQRQFPPTEPKCLIVTREGFITTTTMNRAAFIIILAFASPMIFDQRCIRSIQDSVGRCCHSGSPRSVQSRIHVPVLHSIRFIPCLAARTPLSRLVHCWSDPPRDIPTAIPRGQAIPFPSFQPLLGIHPIPVNSRPVR